MRGIVAPERDGMAGFAEQLGERRAPRARTENGDIHRGDLPRKDAENTKKQGKRPTLNFQRSMFKAVAKHAVES